MYLSIQATSAATERIFSLASRVVSKLRNNLHPVTAGNLLFIASNNRDELEDQIDEFEEDL